MVWCLPYESTIIKSHEGSRDVPMKSPLFVTKKGDIIMPFRPRGRNNSFRSYFHTTYTTEMRFSRGVSSFTSVNIKLSSFSLR